MAILKGQRTKSFIDISLSFEANGVTGDLPILKDERAINNSLRNLIQISPSEVPFRWDVGSKVTSYLFESVDYGTAGLIQSEIERTIKYNEPRVKVKDVIVDINDDVNSFVVTVVYNIIGYDEVYKFTELLTPTR